MSIEKENVTVPINDLITKPFPNLYAANIKSGIFIDNIVVKLKYSIDMLHLEVSDYGIDNLEDEINGRIF